MRLTAITVGTILLLASGEIVAQIAPPAVSQAGITAKDLAYMTGTAKGSAYELRLAQTAAQRSKRDDVRAYAAKLVQDHGAYSAALGKLAQAKGVTLPVEMKAADRTRLLGMDPFTDDAFIHEAVRVNAEDNKNSAAQAARTRDAGVKTFMKQFEVADAGHEQMAQMLKK